MRMNLLGEAWARCLRPTEGIWGHNGDGQL